MYVGLDYRYDSFLKISAFNALGNLGMSVILILGFFKDDRATGRIIGNALPVMEKTQMEPGAGHLCSNIQSAVDPTWHFTGDLIPI